MKNLPSGILNCLIFLLFLLQACGHRENAESTEDARELFAQSAETLLKTIRETKNVTDSAGLDSLMENVEKRLITINFSVPPETDLKLTEQENDSLYHLMRMLQTLNIQKLEEFAKKKYENDSIPVSEE